MRPSRSCWNGTTSFMCVLSIKVLIRKKSGNLFIDPRIYIYIYIYLVTYISLKRSSVMIYNENVKHLKKKSYCFHLS